MERFVVRPGDDVVGWGHLVRDDDGDWFGPPLATRLVVEPVRHSALAVRAVGIDLDDVDDRRVDEHGTTGTATLCGVWTGERLEVTGQRRDQPDWAWRTYPTWDTPPCPPPRGGWPPLPERVNLRADTAALEASGAAVAVCTFRPTPTTGVLVVAAADLAEVEECLRPQLGDALCVVPSRLTRRQVDDTRAVLEDHFRSWGGFLLGESVDAGGQPVLTLDLVMVSAEIAELLRRLPDGVVDVHPWLRPVG